MTKQTLDALSSVTGLINVSLHILAVAQNSESYATLIPAANTCLDRARKTIFDEAGRLAGSGKNARSKS